MNKIVVLEDSESDYDLLRYILKPMLDRYEFYLYANGQQLVDDLITEENSQFWQDVNMMIVDINVPLIDGFEVIESIRNHQASKDVDVCIFSTRKQADDVDRAQSLGVNHYYKKPLGLEEIKALRVAFAEIL